MGSHRVTSIFFLLKSIFISGCWNGWCTKLLNYSIPFKTLVLIDSKLKAAGGAADVRRGKGEKRANGGVQSGGETSPSKILKNFETLPFVPLNRKDIIKTNFETLPFVPLNRKDIIKTNFETIRTLMRRSRCTRTWRSPTCWSCKVWRVSETSSPDAAAADTAHISFLKFLSVQRLHLIWEKTLQRMFSKLNIAVCVF